MVVTVALGLSVVLQLTAGAMALWLIRVTGRRWAWGLIALAITLMAIPRGIRLFGLLAGGVSPGPDLWAELLVLAISVLMVAGLASIALLFGSIRSPEQTLSDSNARLRQIVDAALDAVITIDSDGVVTTWNSQAETIFGWSRAEAVGQTLAELIIPAQHRAAHAEGLKRFLATGKGPLMNKRFEITALRRGGEEFPVELTIAPVRLGGRYVFSGFVRDISDRKQAEQALRDSEQRYRTLVEHAPEAVVVLNADTGHFVDANDNAVQLYGVDRATLLKTGPIELSPPVQPDGRPSDELAQEMIQSALSGETPVFEWTQRNAAGEEVPCEVRLVRLPAAGRNLVRGSVTDIRDRKRAEAALKQANAELQQKNRELEDFASIAAHDLKEPLHKIRAFGDRLHAYVGDKLDDHARDQLHRMIDASQRMHHLIDDLLMYARITTTPKPFEPVDLGRIAREVACDLEARIQQSGGRVEVGCLPTIGADPTQIRQLLQNLIANALKFHRPQVSPIVRVNATLMQERHGPAAPGPSAGQLCHITVEDNGIGFDEKYRDRIFGVFQRLHGRGVYDGTGMGLAVCRRIVERHSGTIEAKSTPGQGATFTVTLPVHDAAGGDRS
ncbi:MAG: PAS domain S-box protein [Phycisphaeraceae bacterium]